MSDTSSDIAWVEVRVHVPIEGRDESYLASLEALCITLSPGGYVVEGEDAPPGDHPPPAPGTIRILLYVEEQQLPESRRRLEEVLVHYEGATILAQPLDPDWRERWKAWFKSFAVSPRLGVQPPWESRPEGLHDDAALVVIEPGMAFGTGEHETTFLCLSALEALSRDAKRPGRILDVGCGTGILSIAAALLWGPEVLGIDVDEAALRSAQDNLTLNSVEGRVTLASTPLAAVEETYPLVLANIIAPVLMALAEDLVARVMPGGELWLSGILLSQEDEVLARYQALGARLLERSARGEWVRLGLSVPR